MSRRHFLFVGSLIAGLVAGRMVIGARTLELPYEHIISPLSFNCYEAYDLFALCESGFFSARVSESSATNCDLVCGADYRTGLKICWKFDYCGEEARGFVCDYLLESQAPAEGYRFSGEGSVTYAFDCADAAAVTLTAEIEGCQGQYSAQPVFWTVCYEDPGFDFSINLVVNNLL